MSQNQKKVLKFLLWALPVGFLENILFGWAQMELGITNQHVETAVRWAIQLGVPSLTVAVGFYLYYSVVEHFTPTVKPLARPPVTPTEPTSHRPPEASSETEPAARGVLKSDMPRKKYAPPADAEEVDITRFTNKQLGELFEALAADIGHMLVRAMRNDADRVGIFHKSFGSRFFWIYEEARRRGHRDSALDQYHDRPESLLNVSHLSQQLRSLGQRLPLYLDC